MIGRLARLEKYLGNIVFLAALGACRLVLLIEHIDAVYAIVLIPLVEIAGDNLAEASRRNVANGCFAVTRSNENVLCLDGLCIAALSIVGDVHRNPLGGVVRACVQVDNLVIYIGYGLIESKHRSTNTLGGNSVGRALAEADLLYVVEVLGHRIFVPVDILFATLFDERPYQSDE